MKVKFRLAVADGEGNTYRSGPEYDIDKAEADHWVGLGYAEPCDDTDEPKATRPKKTAASRPTPGETKEKPVNDEKPAPKKAPAKRTAKKTATKKTAVNRAPSTAEKKG